MKNFQRIHFAGVVAGTLVLAAGSVDATAPEPPDPEATAEQAFAAESAPTFGALRYPACWIDPSGAPIACFGMTERETVVVGIAPPNESFTFTEYSPTAEGAPTDVVGTQPAAAATAAATFGDGIHIVGTDVEPGTYRTDAPDGCYWERLSGLSGEFDDIITNGFVDSAGQVVVEIAPTDAAFSSQDCGTWTRIQ